MGLARARDVLVKTSPPTSKIVRFGLVAGALGIAVSWPNEANAQVVDAPPHRIDFTVSPALPKCDDYDGFYGVLVNWVRVQSIDPSAKRRLVVDIKLQSDGKKRVDLSLLDAEGQALEAESHRYLQTEECFKVLYWTAFDAVRLLRTTVPPPEEDPPPPIEKLVDEVEKTERVKTNPDGPTWDAPGPALESQPSQPLQCELKEEPVRRAKYVVLGLGFSGGLTRTFLPGLRVGVGRSAGPLLLELDANVAPPLISADWAHAPGEQRSARGHAYFGTFALCARRLPLVGCALVSGGVAGYQYDKPVLDGERYAREAWGGFVLLGARMGVEFSVHPKFDLRIDADAQLPVYTAEAIRDVPTGQSTLTPTLSGFVSIVPSF